MTGGEWPLEYYVEDSRRVPVRELLRELDEKTYARLQWSFEQLRQRNAQARQPLVRHIEGRIWELREESRTNIYRILYVFFTGRRIVLLHGFQKKTRRLPPQELAVARQRLGRFLEREGGERTHA
ncbi:MAG TPA: type II toxin-antitoxin system RelE/ParE family toxin [Candidatus Saccharimonadales bacterium]|nr:type II toxin-antitoxin system RelE/ParE family toxin [Candidatus Saccharimonadales bacterium]